MEFSFLNIDFQKAIGWSLVHSLWQILVIAIVLKAVLLISRKSTPGFKFNFMLASLVFSLISFVVTFFVVYTPATVNSAVVNTSKLIVPNIVFANQPQSILTTITAFIDAHVNTIVFIWIVGIMLYILKIVFGFLYVENIKRNSTPIIDNAFTQLFEKLCRRIGISRCVKVLESMVVKVPMVMGHLKPVLLLPAGLLTGMPYNQIEAIMAHELAHIYRRDFLVNIIVVLIESLFFYHPAIWWITSAMDDEREKCCDDIAVKITGSKLIYAKALTSVIEKSIAKPQMALALSSNKQKLYLRISRLLKDNDMKSNLREKMILPIALLLVISTLAFASNVNNPNSTLQKALLDDFVNKDKKENKAKIEVKTVSTKTKTNTGTIEVKTSTNSDGVTDGKNTSSSSCQSVKAIANSEGYIVKTNFNDDLITGSFTINTDTLKSSNKTFFTVDNKFLVISKKVNGENVYLVLEGDKIKELKIDSKIVPVSEYSKYEDLVKECLGKSTSTKKNNLPKANNISKTVVISTDSNENVFYSSSNNDSYFYLNKKIKGDRVKVAIDGNTVKELEVNGKVIPESEYKKHKKLIKECIELSVMTEKDICDIEKDLIEAKEDLADAEIDLIEAEKDIEEAQISLNKDLKNIKLNLNITSEKDLKKLRKELERVKNIKVMSSGNSTNEENIDIDVEAIMSSVEFAMKNLDIDKIVGDVTLSLDNVSEIKSNIDFNEISLSVKKAGKEINTDKIVVQLNNRNNKIKAIDIKELEKDIDKKAKKKK